MNRLFSLKKGQKGQALVEFALVLPLLLLLILLAVQFGFILNAYITLTHLSREGARYAAVHPQTDQAIKDYMETITPSQINTSDLTISVSPAEGDSQRVAGGSISVTLNYNLQSKIFLPTSFLGFQVPTTLPAVKAVMVIE